MLAANLRVLAGAEVHRAAPGPRARYVAYFKLRSRAPRPLHQGQDARRGRLWFSEDASELTEVANGLPPRIAFEDGVAALHEDENLVEIVSAREDGCAFRVDRSEHELSVRVP